MVGGDIDDRVPPAAFESREIPSPVAAEVLDLREELRVRPAAVEERHVMAVGEGGVHERPPDETRASQDQQPHGIYDRLTKSIETGTPSRPNFSRSWFSTQ